MTDTMYSMSEGRMIRLHQPSSSILKLIICFFLVIDQDTLDGLLALRLFSRSWISLTQLRNPFEEVVVAR